MAVISQRVVVVKRGIVKALSQTRGQVFMRESAIQREDGPKRAPEVRASRGGPRLHFCVWKAVWYENRQPKAN